MGPGTGGAASVQGSTGGALGAASGGTAASGTGGSTAAGGTSDGSDSGGSPGAGGAATGGAGGDQATGGTGGSPTWDDDCAGHAEVDFSLVGWATQDGETTGGKGGTTVTVSTGDELLAALDAKDESTPLTILVDGTITPGNTDASKIDIKDVDDVSVIGVGTNGEFDGIGLKLWRTSNVVLRNLHIHHVDTGEKDAISIEGPVDHVWVDHCELDAEFDGVDKDYYDGLLDAKADAEYITYSWNYLHDSWKTALVGSSESDTHDRKLTMHHNRFSNCNSRTPLFRGGQGHVFNNLYEDVASTAINSRQNACLLIENNSFFNVKNPWVSAYSDTLGGGDLVCNDLDESSTFSYSDDVHELPACEASVPYDYSAVLNHQSQVPSLVRDNAGVGKLEDATDF